MANTKRSAKTRPKHLTFSNYSQFLLGLVLILFGAGLLFYIAVSKIPPFLLDAENHKQEQTVNHKAPVAKPVKLYIPKIAKILYVSEGFLAGNRWTISVGGVSYLTASAMPGEGNTVFYGHNTKDVLGGLWRVQDGDYIYVILASGDFIKYQIFERKEIEPTQVAILNQTEDSRLTLYTCSGFLDTARFVVVARQEAKTSPSQPLGG